MTEETKLALKENAISYWFTVFTCGGPCHLSTAAMINQLVVNYQIGH